MKDGESHQQEVAPEIKDLGEVNWKRYQRKGRDLGPVP